MGTWTSAIRFNNAISAGGFIDVANRRFGHKKKTKRGAVNVLLRTAKGSQHRFFGYLYSYNMSFVRHPLFDIERARVFQKANRQVRSGQE
jgi:hypothetical protein